MHLVLYDYFEYNVELISFLCLCLILPTLSDGVKQYIFDVESTNKKRIFTGIIAGIGIYFYMYFIL